MDSSLGIKITPTTDQLSYSQKNLTVAATTSTLTLATPQTTATIKPNQPISSNINNNNIDSINNNASQCDGGDAANTAVVVKSKNCNTENQNNNDPIKELDTFFANGHYNSCQATDQLIKHIEQSQDEALAKKALQLYQRHYSTLERPWDHVTFLYGLGLIYMHFNAYNWAVKSFREAIYVQPNFERSKDVHTRLGLIFKSTGRYKLSEKHFYLAIYDTRPQSGTCSNLQLRFHLAHLHEIQGKINQAIEAYEALLKEDDLPKQLSANIHRQLGWLYFSHPETSQDLTNPNDGRRENTHDISNQHNQHRTLTKKSRLDAALNYLNASYQTDSDPKTSYYLGRCLTDVGKFQDAFASYRSVIDREESTADTWCSIGVLYHRQNQPMDALQAYIRCVQFDKKHSVAWMNLGILYESYNQFNDALKCYQHVLRSRTDEHDRMLHARIKYIQKHMADIGLLSNNNKSKVGPDKLLSLEDLWNLESKTSHEANPSANSNNSITTNANNSKSFQATHKSPTTSNTDSQITIANNNNNKSDSTSIPVPQATEPHKQINNTGSSIPEKRTETHLSPADEQDRTNLSTYKNSCVRPENHILGRRDSKQDEILSNSNQPVHPKPTTTSNHINLENNSFKQEHDPTITTAHGSGSSTSGCSSSSSQDFKSQDHQQTSDSKEFNFNPILTNGGSKDSGISSNSSTSTDCALVPSHSSDIIATDDYMSAEQVIESYKSCPKPKKIDVNLLSDEERPPCTFPKPPPYPPVSADKLSPSPPNLFVETKKDALSKVQGFCQSNPISLVRNIANVLKLDLGLFSTKALVESNPEQQVDVMSHQYRSIVDNNNNHQTDSTPTTSWLSDCERSSSTIMRYASYQVSSFKEYLEEDRDSATLRVKTNLTKESETDSNESASIKNRPNSINNGNGISNVDPMHPQIRNQTTPTTPRGPHTKRMKKEPPKTKLVRAATNIDLSDEKKWRPQLNELDKLPHFIRCVSASNMLTHLGAVIPDINSVAMGMHVPGCRVLGNKTPGGFCPVNINIGPGDYEWFAVPAEYAKVFTRVCNKYGFEFEDDNWWPRLNDLQRHNIPLYRFSQRPGDLVWVNSGTIYWVQAVGWCNNIHWNVGPLCARQYRLAIESAEINKFILARPGVPMVQMTWNIMINISVIPEDDLWHSIVDILRRSLRFCVMIKEITHQLKAEIELSDEDPGCRIAKFCSLCDYEIFNYCFTRKSEEQCIHCIECARRVDPTLNDYSIKQEYEIEYLMKLYDEFIENRKPSQKARC